MNLDEARKTLATIESAILAVESVTFPSTIGPITEARQVTEFLADMKTDALFNLQGMRLWYSTKIYEAEKYEH